MSRRNVINTTNLIIGGTSGIGLALAHRLVPRDTVVIGRNPKNLSELMSKGLRFIELDLRDLDSFLLENNYLIAKNIYICAGVGYQGLFYDFNSKSGDASKKLSEIHNMVTVNLESVAKLLYWIGNGKDYHNYPNVTVISSISGCLNSPSMAVYAATKSALNSLIDSINTEMLAFHNRSRSESGSELDRFPHIKLVAPGYLDWTGFYGQESDIESPDVEQFIQELLDFDRDWYTKYKLDHLSRFNFNDRIYRDVVERSNADPIQFGLESLEYKMKSNRPKRKLVVGYLTGCFDLFHIGHLNLLKNAKKMCDQLVVGLHKDGSHKGKELAIPYEERKSILESCRYVDKVVQSTSEDTDPLDDPDTKFDILFVGSDYKGSDKFKKYESMTREKDFRIIYLPYTNTTSSTMLRDFISK